MAGDDSPSPSAVYKGSGDLPDKNPSFVGDPYSEDNGDSGDHGADTELKRSLSTRHLTMIALGSSIGMGLWLGSGTSLANGGPAGIFLGYCLAGSMIWCVSHSIGEMACVYPLPSAFVQWTGRCKTHKLNSLWTASTNKYCNKGKFVDPAAAFALGWSYWFSYW